MEKEITRTGLEIILLCFSLTSFGIGFGLGYAENVYNIKRWSAILLSLGFILASMNLFI